MTLYLKLLFAAGTPFGIIMGMLHGPVAGVWSGILFGALMSLVLGSLQYISSGKKPNASRVRQEAVLRFEADRDAVFNRCLSALGSIKKCDTIEENTKTFRITAKTGTTWRSFGETITVQVQEEDDRAYVIIKSEPLVRTTLVDYGKNRQNVRVIADCLETYFERTDA